MIYCRYGNICEVLLFPEFREGRIHKFMNLVKIIITIALLKKNENSRIINFVEVPKSEINENWQSPDQQYIDMLTVE